MSKKVWIISLFSLLIVGGAMAADTVLTWPADGKDAILRFTVGKLRQVNSASGQNDLLGDAVAENLSSKAIPSASFYLYLLDKNGKRVGEGYLEVTNLAPGQKTKVPVSVHTMGSYASMQLQPQHLPSDEPLKVKMHITSVPPGATVKVDSQESGVTPAVVPIAPGKHVIEFSKEGYATGSAPVEVAANAIPAGVSVDLNPLSVDTVVLRDGTVLLGNVTSMSATAVSVSVKGTSKQVERSHVARIVLGQRKGAGSSAKAKGKSAATQK
jgi:hypothetical protein